MDGVAEQGDGAAGPRRHRYRGADGDGELAAAAGLTTGGVTTAIDRLERAGYVTRERDAADRRRVTVRPTAKPTRLAREIYGPIVREGNAYLARLDTRTLEQLLKFLRFTTDQQQQHAARLAK